MKLSVVWNRGETLKLIFFLVVVLVLVLVLESKAL